MPSTTRFLMTMPADLRAQLDVVAQAENRSLANLIVYALRQWLGGRGKPARDS
jgi:hypothetical protein